MSHINLYILKKSSIKDLDFFKDVPHTEENGYFLIPLEQKILRRLTVNYIEDDYQRQAERKLLDICPDMAWVETDYFGGIGDQDAKAWLERRVVKSVPDNSTHMSINKALMFIGVDRTDDRDEFDVIYLGKYRSNRAVIDKWEDTTGKTTELLLRRFVLRHIPKEMKLYGCEHRAYTTMFEYIAMVMIPGSTKYYRCVDDSRVKDVHGFDVQFFKETRTLTTESEYKEAVADAVSHVTIEYVDDTIYKFQKVTPYPVGAVTESTSICLLDYQCDSAGDAMLHDKVKDLILFTPDEYFLVSPYHVGVTGRQPKEEKIKKPRLIKKTVEVYECPSCTIGELKTVDDQLKCNRCTYTTTLETT